MVDCKIEGNKAMLTALCHVCEGVVCKPISLARLPEVRSKLDLTIRRVEATLYWWTYVPLYFRLGDCLLSPSKVTRPALIRTFYSKRLP